MNSKTSDKIHQKIDAKDSALSGQTGQSGRDLVQVGRDYIQYINKNYRSGNLCAVMIALIPLLFFLYGIKATGDSVVEILGNKIPVLELYLPKSKNREITELKNQLQDVRREFQSLTQYRNSLQRELDKQQKIIQENEKEIEQLEAKNKALEEELSKQEPPISPKPLFRTASKSWCLQQAQIAKAKKENFGSDTSAIKASLEENNCGYWGITIP